jgi:hypothetical protein
MDCFHDPLLSIGSQLPQFPVPFGADKDKKNDVSWKIKSFAK